MKKWVFRVLIVFLVYVIFINRHAYSNVDFVDDKWEAKFTRGLVNLVTFPVEIPRTIAVTSREDGAVPGWTIGLVKGIGRAVLRAGAGLVEMVTFPFDFPNETKSPLIEPEYAWENWNEGN